MYLFLFIIFFSSTSISKQPVCLVGETNSKHVTSSSYPLHYCSSVMPLFYSPSFFVSFVQAVCLHPFITEAWVRYVGCLRRVCSGQSNTWTGLCPNTSIFPCQYHSTILVLDLSPELYARSVTGAICSQELTAALNKSLIHFLVFFFLIFIPSFIYFF